MSENKLSNIKVSLLIFLFIVMFSFAYFLLYSPFHVNDDQLLIISMLFTSLVVAIPLYVFMEDENIKSTISNIKKNKNLKKKHKK